MGILQNCGILNKKDIQELLALTFGKANVRIMKDLEKGLKYMQRGYPYQLKQRYKDVKNNISASYIRERINIESINVLTDGDRLSKKAISKILNILNESEKETQTKLKEYYKMMCDIYGISAEEPEPTQDEVIAAKITPVLTENGLKGKFDFSGREYFPDLSYFSRFELMNFIDSGLSVLDIKNSISLQFGKVDIKPVIKFYKNLEKKGIIKLKNIKD